ncbi:FecR family protein [Bacteroides sp.]
MNHTTEDIKHTLRTIKELEADIHEIESCDEMNAYLRVQKRFAVSPVWKYVSIAATIALLIVSSFFTFKATESSPLAYIEVSAIPGSKTKVMLPDSSVVWLNSNANLRYPREFKGDSRNVTLLGEALFEVKKNPQKPFIVNMDGMNIKVLGTIFNVLADSDSDVIETTLLEGSVALFNNKSQTGKAIQILSPNQQALFYKTTGQVKVQHVQASSYASWVSGQFYFQRNTLQEIVTTLGRAYNVKIHLNSEVLKNKLLTGQFTNKETLDEILSILQVSARFKYKKEKGEIYITEN